MFNIKEFLNQITNVEGWQTLEETVGLLHIPILVDNIEGAIVEIGSYKGKSTICLATGSNKISINKRPVYAVDPFTHLDDNNGFISMYEKSYFDSFWGNIQSFNLEKDIIPIKKYSNDAVQDVPQKIAALFIDGDHSYEGISRDIKLYANKVIPHGIIAFHDYSNPNHPDVTKVVNEFMENSDFTLVGDYDMLRIIRKNY
ncbi:class I SAM-dependent methyltransferase [Lysinibacillus sp. NPDC097231]|uniref:class I SAM-dependent methyltransferase n=1 Tax=Lysinibacillus sp. NPDC097231 TaxID=3364142 RepID=UPI0037F3063A